MPVGRHGNKGGKKLRRCKPHGSKPNKVKRGALHKKNGPKTRVPIYEPIPGLEKYNRMYTLAEQLREKYEYIH